MDDPLEGTDRQMASCMFNILDTLEKQPRLYLRNQRGILCIQKMDSQGKTRKLEVTIVED